MSSTAPETNPTSGSALQVPRRVGRVVLVEEPVGLSFAIVKTDRRAVAARVAGRHVAFHRRVAQAPDELPAPKSW